MAEQLIISNNMIRASISTIGAQLTSIKKDGAEVLWDGNPDVWAGQAPIVFPICGGLRDDRFDFEGKSYNLEKHGFIRKSEFSVESKTDDSATLIYKSNSETLKHYPFDFEFRVSYKIVDNKVEITYETKNTGCKTMYFSVGGHEGYAIEGDIEDYTVVFEKSETLNAKVLNGNLLEYKTVPILENSNELKLKDEFFSVDALVFADLNSRKVTLRGDKNGKSLSVEFDGFDYFLLWKKFGAKYICIEPWCGIQDYVDSNYDITKKRGIIALKAGETDRRVHSVIL